MYGVCINMYQHVNTVPYPWYFRDIKAGRYIDLSDSYLPDATMRTNCGSISYGTLRRKYIRCEPYITRNYMTYIWCVRTSPCFFTLFLLEQFVTPTFPVTPTAPGKFL